MSQVGLSSSEISEEIKSQIKKFQIAATSQDEGKITSIKVNGDLSPLKYGWGA